VTSRMFRISGTLCLLALALPLAGCGRKGPLEEPSSPSAKQQVGDTRTPEQVEKDNQYSPFVKRQTFPLDPIMN
jgi:predicted small lipoprotein YifL